MAVLNIVDVVVLCIHFTIIILVGLWSVFRPGKRGSSKGYFLAGRDMPFWAVGGSLFASNIGSEHFTGLAGSGVVSGVAYASYEFNAVWVLLLLGWVFLPVYMASGVYTMPEYMKRRFGGRRIQLFLATISMFGYVFTKISVSLVAGATFIQQVFKWNIYLSILALLAITALFTIAGGLAAVIYTDVAQCVIMLLGAFVLMVFAIVKVDGWDDLKMKYALSFPKNTTDGCGFPREDALKLFRNPVDGDLPWPGVFTGMVVTSIWYWCTDQVIVQRTLAARSLTSGKFGVVVAGWLKLSPLFLIIIPGMVSRILYTEEVACNSAEKCLEFCGSSSGCSNTAYARLVVGLLPQGIRGLMLAVMLSALMSSLTSVFNSASTVFTMDFYKLIRKNAPEAELMIVGRIFVAVLIGVSVLWVPIVMESNSGVLMDYLQSVQSAMGAPIAAVFISAVASRRTTEPGAAAGLLVGIVIGATHFIVTNVVYTTPACGQPDTRPVFLRHFHYLYFAGASFLVCLGVTVLVSALTEPIPPKYLYRLTFASRFSRQRRLDLGEPEDMLPDQDMEDIVTQVTPMNEFGLPSPDVMMIETEFGPKKTSKGGGQTVSSSKRSSWLHLSEEEQHSRKCSNIIKRFCGMTTEGEEREARLEKKRIREMGYDVRESFHWARFADANAIVIVGATVLIYVLFF